MDCPLCGADLHKHGCFKRAGAWNCLAPNPVEIVPIPTFDEVKQCLQKLFGCPFRVQRIGGILCIEPLDSPGVAHLGASVDLLLQEAQHKVQGDREKEYGNKLANFSHVGQMQSIMTGNAVSAEQVALNMVCLKLARLIKSPDHYDTLVDIIGYVMCYRDIRRERNPDEYSVQEARFRHEIKNAQTDKGDDITI